MYEFDAKIIEVINRTPTVRSFRFETPYDISFAPGQYLSLEIDTGGEKRSKPFSISNSPTEKGYIEFTKRLTDSDFSKALKALKPGDHCYLKLPFGKFTFEGEYPKVALLSGGIGITPFRSICKNTVDKGLGSDIVMLYGNRNIDEIIFKKDLDTMTSSYGNLRIIYCLTEDFPGGIKGVFHHGYIDEDLITRDVPDYSERIFYVCGPPGMVRSLCKMLESRLGIAKDKIIIERFAGY